MNIRQLRKLIREEVMITLKEARKNLSVGDRVEVNIPSMGVFSMTGVIVPGEVDFGEPEMMVKPDRKYWGKLSRLGFDPEAGNNIDFSEPGVSVRLLYSGLN